MIPACFFIDQQYCKVMQEFLMCVYKSSLGMKCRTIILFQEYRCTEISPIPSTYLVF